MAFSWQRQSNGLNSFYLHEFLIKVFPIHSGAWAYLLKAISIDGIVFSEIHFHKQKTTPPDVGR